MVPHLRWLPAYSVGVQAFDDEHAVLVARANALLVAVEANGGSAASLRGRDLLDDVVECAVAHFEAEERLLYELDWPGLPEHRDSHNLLLRTLLKFKADLRYGRLTPEEAAEFMADWVLSHIVDEDLQYRDYLLARGVR